MNITARGFAFSIDAMVTAIVILLMLFLVTASFSAESNAAISGMKMFRLQKNAVFLADALVKNNAENALFGAAIVDTEKHRVKSNELDFGRVKQAVPLASDEFFVQRLSIKWRDREEEIFRESVGEKNCIAVERVVLFEGEAALVELVVCEK
jgi:hypothetical protein